MFNLSTNRIGEKIDQDSFRSFSMIRDYKAASIFAKLLTIFFLVLLVVMFLPWTQNIQSKGYVTTLKPDQRPQTIHSIIAGRIEQWNVQEGDFVQKGDTILRISEIKDEYFDPDLLSRTQQQITAKEMTVSSYMEKIKALDKQIDAMNNTRSLKIEQALNYIKQAKLKIASDSINVQDAENDYKIAVDRQKRTEQLYNEGLKSFTNLEAANIKVQETLANKIGAQNDLLTSKNKLINSEVELNSIDNQYRDKLSKAESEKFTALSALYDAEAIVTKMQNQYMNYSIRTGFYYIRAQQDGYITKTIRSGIGETVKEGEQLVSIMPSVYDLAVSMYITPMDIPLIQIGQPVRFMFDGWPTIVFSGWPDMSFGTFGGRIVAIDNFISENGLYRILVTPDPDAEPWPPVLRVGSGANGMALLKDVPIWYEIWRNLNGFPPDYYKPENNSNFKPKETK